MWYLKNRYCDVENILAYIGWTWAMLTLAWVSGHGLNMLASFISGGVVHQPVLYIVSCPYHSGSCTDRDAPGRPLTGVGLLPCNLNPIRRSHASYEAVSFSIGHLIARILSLLHLVSNLVIASSNPWCGLWDFRYISDRAAEATMSHRFKC